MFEKEAEEYAGNTRIKDKNTYIGFPDESISEVQDFEGNYIDISERIIKTFKDASEFGYEQGISRLRYCCTCKHYMRKCWDKTEPYGICADWEIKENE